MTFRVITLFAALVFMAGCGDGRPKASLPPLHPVQGKVVKGAVAVSGGAIQFMPATDSPEYRDLAIGAELKPDGTFELSTLHTLSQKKDTGAPAGEFQAIYTPPMGDQTKVSMTDLSPITLPHAYTVKPGTNELTIDLAAQ
jgi:hypothetical protein